MALSRKDLSDLSRFERRVRLAQKAARAARAYATYVARCDDSVGYAPEIHPRTLAVQLEREAETMGWFYESQCSALMGKGR